jgi:O-antigen/teichoic acid export membrane protein
LGEEQFSTRAVAQKTLSSSFFQIAAQGITMITGLARTIILARLLIPDDFGLVALALIFANFVWNFTAFGIDSRLIQRRELEPQGPKTHLTLRLLLALLSFAILLAITPLLRTLYPEYSNLPAAVLAFGGLNVLKAFNMTPFVLLKRRLAFRRIAVISVTSSLVMFVVSILLARAGFGFWSLILGESVAGTLVSTAGFWLYRRPMCFSLGIDRGVARDYFGFGKFVVLTHQLNFLLDRFDDFWAGTALGEEALGYYHQAYAFATYPRKIISAPLQDVFFSTYARLQNDRRSLSKAFFRANSYVLRVGFLFSITLVLIAPEFVLFGLGKIWVPMVSTFQLMVVYCLFDPLLLTAGNLLTACGAPQLMSRIRFYQALFFIPAVVAGAYVWGIDGIAIAADGMLLLGLLGVFGNVRRYVDLSVRKLFLAPALGMAGGLGAVGLLALVWDTTLPAPWNMLLWGILKGGVFTTVYVLTLLLLEGREYKQILYFARNLTPLRFRKTSG